MATCGASKNGAVCKEHRRIHVIGMPGTNSMAGPRTKEPQSAFAAYEMRTPHEHRSSGTFPCVFLPVEREMSLLRASTSAVLWRHVATLVDEHQNQQFFLHRNSHLQGDHLMFFRVREGVSLNPKPAILSTSPSLEVCAHRALQPFSFQRKASKCFSENKNCLCAGQQDQ